MNSLNRRDFLKAASLLGLCEASVQAAGPKGTPVLATHIHPAVRIESKELLRNENAFWMWSDAFDNMTSLLEFSGNYFREAGESLNNFTDEYEFQLAVGKAEHPLTPYPEWEARDCIRSWLQACQSSLELIERGIRRGKYQVPMERLSAFNEDETSIDDIAIPRRVTRLKAAQCSSLLHSGQLGMALRVIRDMLEVARITLNSRGFLIHYAVSLGFHHGTAIEAAQALSLHQQTDGAMLRRLRQLISKSGPAVESLARSAQFEVSLYTSFELERLAKAGSLAELVDLLVKRVSFRDDESRRLRAGVHRLLRGHPSPFDAAETMELYSGVVAEWLADLGSSWLERKAYPAAESIREVASWPQSLWLAQFLVDERETVTNERVDVARSELLKVRNPVGKHMLNEIGSFDTFRRVFHIGQLRTDATLVVIACRMFQEEHRRLPTMLSELVDASLLDSVPLDPFSGEAIRYDANRQLIWSFGYNEKDDNGDFDFAADPPRGEDLAWRVSAN